MTQVVVLEILMSYLKALPGTETLQELGIGTSDHTSTLFLKSSYQHIPHFLSTEHWSLQLTVVCHAVNLQHPLYYKSNMLSLFQEMQFSGVTIPSETFALVIGTILKTKSRLSSKNDANHAVKKLHTAMDNFEKMCVRCITAWQPISGAIYIAIIRSHNATKRLRHDDFSRMGENR